MLATDYYNRETGNTLELLERKFKKQTTRYL